MMVDPSVFADVADRLNNAVRLTQRLQSFTVERDW